MGAFPEHKMGGLTYPQVLPASNHERASGQRQFCVLAEEA